MDQMYLENLEEFINDESKMVTYKWLSRNLQVHVNQAKQMLYKFVQEQRNKADNDNLCVTYCVAGFTTNEDGNKVHKVQIVPEERCDVVKKNFNPVTTCHIYSVQKGKLKDVNMLFTADYDQLKENLFHSNKFSAITCITAKLRSTNEIEELQSRASIKTEQTQCVNGHSTTNGTAHHEEKKKISPSNKQGGIAGMFAAVSKKKETEPSEDVKKEIGTTKTDASKKPEGGRAKGKQGGVMSLFANQANKPKVEKKPDQTAVSPKKENKEDRITRGEKKKGKSDEENESDKKRRRVHVWESGSSGSENEMEIEEPVPSPPPPEPQIKEESADPSPTPSPRKSPRKSPAKSSQPEPSTSPEKSKSPAAKGTSSGHKRRIKQRKMVTKTFVDDDGYIVTEKVNEEVSTDASDSEDVIPSKTSPAKKSPSKPAAKKPSPKKKSPGKSKQQNIMSFFKKK